MKKKVLVVYGSMTTGGTTTAIIPFLKALSVEYEVDLLLGMHDGECMDSIPASVNILPAARIRKSELTVFQKAALLKPAIKSACAYFCQKKDLRAGGLKDHVLSDLLLFSLSRPTEKHYDVAIGFIAGWADQYTALCTNADKRFAWIHAQIDYIVSHPRQERKWMDMIDKFVFVTKSNQKKFDVMFPEYSSRSMVFENIIDPERIRENSLVIPADDMYRSFIDFAGMKIVTVCRLTENIKGLDRVVNSARILKECGVSFIWYIMGDGDDRTSVMNRIKERNVEDCLILCGNITNPFPYVKAADLFVLLSRFEGKPICVTEALVLGTPSIVTKYPSAEEQIVHGKNGFVIDNSDDAVEEFMSLLAEGKIDYQAIRKKMMLSAFDVINPTEAIERLIED